MRTLAALLIITFLVVLVAIVSWWSFTYHNQFVVDGPPWNPLVTIGTMAFVWIIAYVFYKLINKNKYESEKG